MRINGLELSIKPSPSHGKERRAVPDDSTVSTGRRRLHYAVQSLSRPILSELESVLRGLFSCKTRSTAIPSPSGRLRSRITAAKPIRMGFLNCLGSCWNGLYTISVVFNRSVSASQISGSSSTSKIDGAKAHPLSLFSFSEFYRRSGSKRWRDGVVWR